MKPTVSRTRLLMIVVIVAVAVVVLFSDLGRGFLDGLFAGFTDGT